MSAGERMNLHLVESAAKYRLAESEHLSTPPTSPAPSPLLPPPLPSLRLSQPDSTYALALTHFDCALLAAALVALGAVVAARARTQ
jgi:hypothetical protein